MAQKGTAASGVYILSSATGSNTNYTWACWYRDPSTPGTGSTAQPIAYNYDTSGNGVGFSWHHTNSSFTKAAYHRDTGGSWHAAQMTASPSADTWYHLAGTWDGSSLKLYVDGSNDGSASPSSMSNSSAYQLSLLAGGQGAGSHVDGQIAEAAYWTTALSADELGALAAGVSPAVIRPASLLHYFPLVRTVQDLIVPGHSVSSPAPTVQDHPAVLYPPPLWVPAPPPAGVGRTTKNTDSNPLGIHTGMAWRINQP